MRFQYLCALDQRGQHMLDVCIDRVCTGESAEFFSELHNAQMVGKVIWVQGRTVTVEVEPA